MPREPGIDDVSRFMGIHWEDVRTTRMAVRPELMNAAGFLAGVATYAMVDYTMGSALWRETSEEEAIATLNISINYVQTARDGELTCTADVDRRTRSNAVLRSEVRHGDGTLIATAVGAYVIYPRRDRSRPGPPASDG